MNIKYERIKSNYTTKIKFDKTKSNILILGKADTYEERCIVINPMGITNAELLYGKNSDLYISYKEAINITQDYNVFTANCKTYEDYKNTIENVIHYNFDYVVPIGLKFEDTFYDLNSKQVQYYVNYFMYLIEQTEAITTMIFTNNHSKNYETIDKYLNYIKKELKEYYNSSLVNSDNYTLLERNASDIMYVLNNLEESKYANVILAAQLANKNYTIYPSDQYYTTYYDIDSRDIDEYNLPFHKYNPITNQVSIDNLVNLRLTADIYKNALIDSMIKSTIKALDLDEFKGRIYNGYVKLQIENKVKKIMDSLIGKFFKNYELKNIGFAKTEATAGYIYLELSIMPYGFMDYIDMVMEV